MKWIALTLITLASAAALADRPERNAFVNYSIHSVRDLVQEVKKDPAVADRYERHFGMTIDEVETYISGLHEARLESAAVFEVYSVPPDGHIKMHYERIREGIAVFADASGVPVMLVKCGNPVLLHKQGEVGLGGPSGPEAPLMETPIGVSDTPTPDLALAPPPTPPDLFVPPAETVVPPPVDTFTGVGPTSSANYGWLGIVAAGGLIYGLTTIHGHDHHPHPTPTPEPASYAVLGLGMVGMLALKKKKKD